MENKGAIGKITQVISAVLDIKFPEGHLPEINDAIRIPLKKGGELIVEVAQHLGDDTVRCIALGPTDGLVRGMDAIATGGPISVPVGEKTLGRLFNVLGEPIDEIAPPQTKEHWPIHRKAPSFEDINLPSFAPDIIPKTKPITPESIHEIPISHIDDKNFCPITSKTGLLYIIEVPQSPLIIDLNHDQNLTNAG